FEFNAPGTRVVTVFTACKGARSPLLIYQIICEWYAAQRRFPVLVLSRSESTISAAAARRSAKCRAANSSIVNAVLIQRMLPDRGRGGGPGSGRRSAASPSSRGGLP